MDDDMVYMGECMINGWKGLIWKDGTMDGYVH
jgi:hypothetical protein